jgi:hypothetical protein
VDSVSGAVETHPSGADRIAGARHHRFAIMVVHGVGDAALNLEGADWARGSGLANGNGVDLRHLASFNEGQLAIFQADDDYSILLRLLRREVKSKGRCQCCRHRPFIEVKVFHRIPDPCSNHLAS